MDILILLVPLSLLGVGVAAAFFFRMSASGQFDDVEGPARSILMDDDRPRTIADRAGIDRDQAPFGRRADAAYGAVKGTRRGRRRTRR